MIGSLTSATIATSEEEDISESEWIEELIRKKNERARRSTIRMA